MKRNFKRLGCLTAALLLVLCLLPVGAGAAEAEDMPAYDGFVFKFREDMVPMGLFGEDGEEAPDGIRPLEFGYFKADDLETLAAFTRAEWLELVEPDYIVEPFGAPNDPEYTAGKQWSLSAIDMSYPWAKGLDGTGVLVGIVDSGVVKGHEDMDYSADHMAQGKCFVSGMPAADVGDGYGHGTLVTSIIGAATNNGKGVAGIAPKAKLMPLRVFDSTGKGGTVTVVGDAIKYGADQGCDILNMSLGVFGISDYLQKAVQYAADKGVIMIAAAGNGNSETGTSEKDYEALAYPAAYDGVIGVSRLDLVSSVPKVQKDTSTNCQHNDSVDVAAPGGSIYGLSRTGGYGTMSGTSFSCPTVAAVAALCKQAKPDLTQGEFLELLKTTSVDDGDIPGWDEYYGWGMLNASALLRAIDEACPRLDVALSGSEVTVDGWKIPADGTVGSQVLVVAAGYNSAGQMCAAAMKSADIGEQKLVDVGTMRLQMETLPARVSVFIMAGGKWNPLRKAAEWRAS